MEGKALGSVMVVGGGIAGMQAALDLANSGYYVHLVEKKPAIGGAVAQLDKTFPTNDCAMWIVSPKLVEVGRHSNIEVHTLSELKGISGDPGNFTITLEKHPRYVDPAKCTGCGDCAKICPVSIPDEFNAGLAEGRAIYRLYPQAIPPAFAIKKLDRAPCTVACPAGINVQGYIQLVKMGKYEEAIKLIMERLPLPGVLGRICPHPCEKECRRQEMDEPVAICSLKRFVADQVDLTSINPPLVEARAEKVAIIGSGPAGLTCAYQLALRGCQPTIFEALPVAGGMLRVGIPDYRLPKEVLDREINNILRLGVELRTNNTLGKDFTLKELFDQSYKAIFLGIGCHAGKPLGIPGEKAKGVMQGVEFLRRHNLGEPLRIGKRVAVIGGGNVAMDVACSARRLGSEVTIVYRRSREEMPAHVWEIEQAMCEGVEILYLAAPLKILVRAGRVTGLLCQRMKLGKPDASGRRRPVPIKGSEFELQVDMVVPAVGQTAALTFLERSEINLTKWGTIEVDEITYQTSLPGVFAAGDVRTGPWIAIEAVRGGMEAAESIDRYLQGVDLTAGRVKRGKAQARWAEIPKDQEARPREVMPTLAPGLTCTCFAEIAQGYTEAQAQAEATRCLNCGICSECMQCIAACQAGAIDHRQQPETIDLRVGAVILTPGFKPFDPSQYETYQYASHANVVTSLEFERILSASGPFAGHLVRPSDRKTPPKKIAWLQCVGSRDLHHGDHRYCSAVCCMSSIKQAMLAQEHSKAPLDTTIFYIDMRTPGKDFEKYYQRAAERGVRFIRSRVHSIAQVPGAHDLALRYLSEDGVVQTETFDLVVLSVGLEVSPEAVELADTLGIDLHPETGFAATSLFTPITTNKPGIFVCGAFQGPKDIPQSVTEASAAAAAAGELLSAARYSLFREPPEYPERDISQEEPRLGVFICHCGTNIAGVIDVAALRDYAGTLPQVEYAENFLFACSQDSQKIIRERIQEHGLNRVVVASCSPRTHEAVFQEALKEAGLNPYLLEMANIRDQDAWVHMAEPEAALEKARDLVRMAAARAANLEPLHKDKFPVTRAALIIGGGVAGLEAARSLANMGFQAYLVEKNERLGGNAWNLEVNSRGYDYRGYLKGLIQAVENQPQINIMCNSRVKETGGFIGNFQTIVATPGGDRELEHGVTILATGGTPLVPQEYLYGQHPNVLLSFELDQAVASQDPRVVNAQQAVFIQCVGSREPERPYCSRVCCTHSVDRALVLKELNPDMDIFIMYRDLCTYGDKELLYQEAREKGVVFIRYDLESKPRVARTPAGGLEINVQDPILGRLLVLRPDLLTLASAILPSPTAELTELFKVARNTEGFFSEAHAKLRPVDCMAEGIYLAGMAHYPKPLDESIAQAKAAAARAATVLALEEVAVEPLVSRVDQDLCLGCGLCEITCPFGAMRLTKVTGKGFLAENLPAYCKGCGLCAAGCPVRAVDMLHFLDRQILAAIHAGGRG